MKSFFKQLTSVLSQLGSKWELVLYGVFLWLSTWIMFKTFSYDAQNGQFLIGTKIWSDYGATLPLIRSFSFGDNWPPEYPIFPGEPIRYHFLFFFLVGMLEKAGLPIDWALNIPSALGFFAILAMVYAISKRLFHDARVGLLSTAFFLFNGSLSFLQFFQKHPLSASTLKDIVTSNQFTAMGPWDGGKVLGTWHLNVFLNQRHFVVALGILMIFLFTCLWLENRGRKSHLISAIVFGTVIGFFTLLHKPVLLMFAVAMTVFFLALPYLRLFLLVMGAVSLGVMGLIWLMSFNIAGSPSDVISWFPGFTIHEAKSSAEVLSFFWYQFGLHCFLVPIGLLLAPWRAKIFMLPALIVFAIAFMFRFSNDIMANHKFINFGLIMAQMLSAYALFRTYDFIMKREISGTLIRWFRSGVTRLTTAAVIFFLTFSGILDAFAVINESYYHLEDIKLNPMARWFYENTPKNAVVLNSVYTHHPATIAGRKIFLGWAYFTWSAGYDHNGRWQITKKIFAGEDPQIFCPLLRANNISYITTQDTSGDHDMPPVNYKYFQENFTPSFISADEKYAVYSTEQLCAVATPHATAPK